MPGKVKDVRVASFWFHADEALQVTAGLKSVSHSFTQGDFEMVGIVDTLEAEQGDEFDTMVEWFGFVKSNFWEQSI